MFIEQLEPRELFAVNSVYLTRPPTRASENGPTIRGFRVWRTGDSSADLTVKFQIGGSATNGVDYGKIGSQITIPAGVQMVQVKVRPFDDTKVEKVETCTMTLLADAAYDFGVTPQTTIRITDNDFVFTSNTITWSSPLAPSPIKRAEALRAVVDGKIYVFGGFNEALGPVKRSDVYNPASNSWSQITDLPERTTHAGVAVDGHDIYIAGGYLGLPNQTGYNQTFGTAHVWKYNVDTNTYTAMPDMPKEMAGGGAAVVNRVLHYFGGDNISRNDDPSHFALNLDNTAAGWTSKADMLNARSHLGGVVYGGKIYAVAGQHGNDAGLTTQMDLDVYDPATDQWTALPDAPLNVSHIASATVVLGSRIIVLGGETANGAATSQVHAFDIATNQWVTMTSLPAARFSGVAAVVDNAIYFTTGSSQTTTWKGVIA